MKVEIWSDTMCPYCYIGKRKYEQALAQFPHAAEIETVWRSYLLDPDIKKGEKIPQYDYMAQLRGWSKKEAIKMHDKLTKFAQSAGLDYHFDKVLAVNTLDAHRLVHLAKQAGLGSEAEEALFKAFFTDGKDISDRQTLINLGESIGLQGKQVADLLAGKDFQKEVLKECDEANQLGLDVIPFFLFNRKHILTGSQPVEEILEVLTIAYDEWKGVDISSDRVERSSGASCSIDGVCE